MTMRRALLAFGCIAAALATGVAAPVDSVKETTLDRRVEALLRRMTLEEKVGQMNMPCVYEDALGDSREAKLDAVR